MSLSGPRHVLVAPDKFKGSLSASEVAAHIAAGLRRAAPDLPVATVPVADGGEGTVDAAVGCGFTRRLLSVVGPTGGPAPASYAVGGDTAIVELAEASGLRHGIAPLTASSFGAGELIAAAVRDGARRTVVGLGGSACTDGGAGMAVALGVRFLDGHGHELPAGGAALRELHAIDVAGLDPGLHDVTVVVASDVDNPLLGEDGAAAVYGPQKGATEDEVRVLEAGLTRLAEVARRDLGVDMAHQPGAGAAGGVGFGAMAFLSAVVRPGISHLLELLGFTERLSGARLVVTGEGSLDAQTLRGKAPAGVARTAVQAGVPVVAVAGRNALSDRRLRGAGFRAAYALTDIEPDPARCMAAPGPLLERTAERIARDWMSVPAPFTE